MACKGTMADSQGWELWNFLQISAGKFPEGFWKKCYNFKPS